MAFLLILIFFYGWLCATEKIYIIKNWGQTLNSARSFRKMSDPVSSCNTCGLCTLPASGSGQFSEKGLEEIVKLIERPIIYIVDLRQESHGILIDGDNSYPISWYKEHNSINWNKSSDEIHQEELLLCSALQAPVDIYSSSWLLGPTKIIKSLDKCVTEEQIIAAYPGLHYKRFTVADDQAPTDEQIDEFVAWIKTLPANAWLHFHCMAGRGRTTTFLCLFDIIHNAREVEFNEIINRQALIGGINLFERLFRSSWHTAQYRRRKQVMHDFYTYAHETMPSFDEPFSLWKRRNEIINN